MRRELVLGLIINFVHVEGLYVNSSKASKPGLFIVGGGQGYGDELQLITGEIFIPSTGESCYTSRLPDTRLSHTMDGEYLCGSQWVRDYDSQTTCLKFSFEDNEWTYSHDLNERRCGHSSWMTDKGLLLMGSWYSDTTTELVNLNGISSTSFKMEYPTKYACAIPHKSGNSVILTGGGFKEEDGRRVTKYNKQGFVKDMPQLNEGRMDHGCGSYLKDDGTQVLLITGGMDYRGMHVASTEILVGDSDSWQTVTPLPPLPYDREGYGGIKGATLGNTLYMTGGYDGRYEHNEILEWKPETEEWIYVGTMRMTRSYHSVTAMSVPDDFCASV